MGKTPDNRICNLRSKPISVKYKFKFDEPKPDAILEGLRQSVKRAILKKGMRAASKVLRQKVKSLIQKGESGALRQSIGTRIKQSSNVVFGVTGARSSYVKGNQRPVFYLHLYEAGRNEDVIKKKKVLFGHGKFWGTSVQGFQGRRPLENAFNILKDQMQTTLAETIRTEIAARLTK